jgi:NAD(P)-dependent dehydrogenase (short-subunit alcohol dehydrogenase family)
VVATARNTDALKDLVAAYGNAILPIRLDVNDRAASFAAIAQARAHFGTLDVVINNAGYGLFGTIEETSEQEARDQLETNVFGTLWVTQAALPIMREQGRGHIVQVTSVLGLVTLPVMGLYNASKWAVEAISETLAAEVKDFGIKVTIVEPNGFSTDFAGASAVRSKEIGLYDEVRRKFAEGITDDSYGEPEATSDTLLKIVDEENPPLRIFLGKVGLPWVSQVYTERLATWEEWKEDSAAAHRSVAV